MARSLANPINRWHYMSMGRVIWVCALLVACSDDEGRPVGVIDAASNAACAAFPNGVPITAAPSVESASSVEVHRETGYRIALDDDGFVTLHADVGHFDWAIFVGENTTLANDELGFPGATRAGACPDVGLWDYRVHVHEAGEYPLHIHHHGSEPLFLYAYRTESSHSGDASVDDGGHHEGDAGHEHEH